jgi:predicted DNA-binding transcriptional regulator AlpA
MNKEKFIKQLRTEIQNVIREEIRNLKTEQPTWLRSSQVRKMLGISDSTLQTLRINQTIPAYKIGATWLYKPSEIESVLESNCTIRKEGKHA